MTFPSFASGEVLTANDMNAVGLWRVTGCTVTSAGGTAATASNGVITIGAGNTSVTVNNAFSTDYDNYRIVIAGGVSSVAAGACNLTLGAAATGYYRAGAFMAFASGAVTGFNNANDTSWRGAVEASTSMIDAVIDLLNPFATKNTILSSHTTAARTDGYSLFMGGYLANTTSYSAFTLTASAGNLTGGTIRVYGYRN